MLPNITYILRTYGYFVVGTMLILINIPVFLLVIIRKALRNTYVVIAIVFLNNGFTGISVILLGMKRLIYSADEELISHHECVLSMSILIFTSYFLNGLSLLTNSLERFCVVAFPIYYYTHSTRISYSLITAQYVITITAITVAVIASLIEPTRLISKFCIVQEVYLTHFYEALLLLTSVASFLSVVFMVIVVVVLRKKFGAQFLSSHSHNRDLSHFLKNQKRYTQTALISCCFTFCGNIPLACSSCHCTVNGGMYLPYGFFYNIANHCDVLRIFAPTEFLQLGGAIFISSKRFPVRRSAVFQIPIQ
uniref:G-protein coupled receptors family 1 profile domain-containing protein n=1 Tax=Wuchereria bancrofti TaxID=6293 RepID=A0AAF5PZI9_WUCBA